MHVLRDLYRDNKFIKGVNVLDSVPTGGLE